MKKLNAALMKLLRVFLSFFGKGLITLMPVLIVCWLFGFFWGDGMFILRDIIAFVSRRLFPEIVMEEWKIGLGLILTILFIGLISSSVFKRIYACAGRLIGKLIQKSLIGKIKEQYQNQGMVIFEFRKGIWVSGIIVGYIAGSEKLKGGRFLKIFIPNVPIPLTGFSPIFIQESKVIHIDIPLDEVFNTYISGGILAPKKLPELVRELEKRETISKID